MERKRYVLTLLMIILTINLLASNRVTIYQAYINNDMSLWKTVIDQMEKQNDKTYEYKLELLNYQYGYIGWCIGQKKYDTAREYIALAEKNVDFLEKNNYKPSTIYAYKSAFIGFEIGLNKLKAPFIGLKSVDYAQMASELDPDDHFAYNQSGNIEFYMPSIFGGSKKRAIYYYLKAKNIMEKDEKLVDRNWNYLSLLATIIKAYLEIKDYQKANTYCELALEKEPDFLWVKNELYPEIQKYLKI